MKLTSGVRKRERQQVALDNLIKRYTSYLEDQANDARLERMAKEIEKLKREIGV